LSFKEGGLTEGQFQVLYEQAVDREAAKNKFWAKLHGFEIKDSARSKQGETGSGYHEEVNEFNYNGDPASVAHLSPEEREELTRKLMGQMKKDAANLEMPKPNAGR